MSDVTQILNAIEQGDPSAAEPINPKVHLAEGDFAEHDGRGHHDGGGQGLRRRGRASFEVTS